MGWAGNAPRPSVLLATPGPPGLLAGAFCGGITPCALADGEADPNADGASLAIAVAVATGGVNIGSGDVGELGKAGATGTAEAVALAALCVETPASEGAARSEQPQTEVTTSVAKARAVRSVVTGESYRDPVPPALLFTPPHQGTPTELVVYPNEAHGFAQPGHRRDRIERMAA